MYPLKFEPILKQTLWGGDKIIPFKHLNSDLKGVGESWEISPTPFKSEFKCLNGIILSPPQSVCFRIGSNFNGYIFVFLVNKLRLNSPGLL